MSPASPVSTAHSFSALLAANNDVAAMAEIIGVDSLSFLSMDGLYRAMGEASRNQDAPQYCDACFSGEYPIALTDHDGGNTIVQLSLLAELGEAR